MFLSVSQNFVICIVLALNTIRVIRAHDLLLFDEFSYSFNLLDANDWDEHHLSATPDANDYASKCTKVIPVIFKQLCVSWNTQSGFRFSYHAPESVHSHLHDTDWFYADKAQQLSAAHAADTHYGRLLDEQERLLGDDAAWNEINYANQISSFTLNSDETHNHFLHNFASGSFKQCRHSVHLQECTHFDLPSKTLTVNIKTARARRHANEKDEDWQEARAEKTEHASAKQAMPANLYASSAASDDEHALDDALDFDSDREFEYGDARGYHNWAADAMQWDTFECSNCGPTEHGYSVRGRRLRDLQSLYQRYGEFTYLFHDHELDFANDQDWAEISQEGGRKCSIAIPGLEHKVCADVSHSDDDAQISLVAASHRDIDDGYYDMYGYDMYYYNVDHLYPHAQGHLGSEHNTARTHAARVMHDEDNDYWYDDKGNVGRSLSQHSGYEDEDEDEDADADADEDTNYTGDDDYYHTHSDQHLKDDDDDYKRSAQYSDKGDEEHTDNSDNTDSDAERDSDAEQQQQQQSQLGTMADEEQGFQQGFGGQHNTQFDPMAQYPDAYPKIKEREEEEEGQEQAQPQQQQQQAQGMSNQYGNNAMYGSGMPGVAMNPMLSAMSGYTRRRRRLTRDAEADADEALSYLLGVRNAAYDDYDDDDEDDDDADYYYEDDDDYDDDGVVYEEDLQDLQRFLQNDENDENDEDDDEMDEDEYEQLMESEQQRMDAMNGAFIASLRDELGELALNFNDDDLWDDITYVHGNGETGSLQKWIRKCAAFQTVQLCATTQHPQHRDLRLNVKLGKHKFHRRHPRHEDARTAMYDVFGDVDEDKQQRAAAASAAEQQRAVEWAIDENVIDVDDDEWNNNALWSFVDAEAHRTLHANKVVIRKCRGRSFCLCQYVDVSVDRGQKHKCIASHTHHLLQPHYRLEHAMGRFMAAPIATAMPGHGGGHSPVHVQFQFRPSIVHLHIMGKYPFFRRRHHMHRYRIPWFAYRRYQHLRPTVRPAWCPPWIWREIDMHLKRPQGFVQVHKNSVPSGSHLDEDDYYQYDAHMLDALNDNDEIDDDFDDELPFLSPLLRMGTELLPNVLRNARKILPKVLRRSVSKGGFIHSALDARGGPQHLGTFGGFGGGKIRRSFGDISLQRKRKHDRLMGGGHNVMDLFGAPHLRGVPSLRRGMLDSVDEYEDDDQYGEFEYFGQELDDDDDEDDYMTQDDENDAESEQRSDVADQWFDQETGMDWVMLSDDFGQELQALRDEMIEWQSIRSDIVGDSGRSIQRRCMQVFGRTLCICEFLEFIDALDADHLCYPKKAKVFPAQKNIKVPRTDIAPVHAVKTTTKHAPPPPVHAPPLPLSHRLVGHKEEREFELRHDVKHSVQHKQTRHEYNMEVQIPHSTDLDRKKVLLRIRLKHFVEQIVHKMKERRSTHSRKKTTHVAMHAGTHFHSPRRAQTAIQQAQFRFRRAQMKLLKRRAMQIRNAIKKGLPHARPLWLPAYFWHWLHFGPHFHVLRHKYRTPWQWPHSHTSGGSEKQKLHVLDLKKKHDKKIAAHQEKLENVMDYDLINLNDAYDDDFDAYNDYADYSAYSEQFNADDADAEYYHADAEHYDADVEYYDADAEYDEAEYADDEYNDAEYADAEYDDALNDLSVYNDAYEYGDEEEDRYEFGVRFGTDGDRDVAENGQQLGHSFVWMIVSVSLVVFCLCTFCINIGLRRRRRKIQPTFQEQQYLQQALEVTESESGAFDQ